MDNYRERFYSLVRSAGAVAWPLKMLAGAVISIVTGGGVLTFLTENAAYHYAMTYGFRPAFEGVDFVGPVVTAASSGLVVLGVILAVAISVIVKLFFAYIKYVSKEERDSLIDTYRALSFRRTILLAVFVSLLLATLIHTAFHWAGRNFAAFSRQIEVDAVISIWILAFMISVTLLLMIWRPALSFAGAAAIVILYYVTIGLTVLPADDYARQLRKTGYGGGIHVSLELKNGDKDPRVLDAYLLMRTREWMVVYDEHARKISEYPLADVSRISVKDSGLRKIDFRLPPKVDSPYSRSDTSGLL
ncbi:hypothetical protein [Massilia sp. DD77]|uniref:hypothetical protein n=1 Tax=Massilia sp. DD77 TaxID=3109349 RepID=UPI0030006A52